MARVALVAGATGIIGGALTQELVRQGWPVLGLARRPSSQNQAVTPISADLLDSRSLTSALKAHEPTHVFLASWMRNDTEAENIRVNSAMVRNLLNVLSPKKSVRHVGLVTGCPASALIGQNRWSEESRISGSS